MTPNNIITALLDIASAAFKLQHGVTTDYKIGAPEDLDNLRHHLNELDKLPQPANMPPLTPSAKARHYMMEFIGGRPVEIDSKEFSAAFWLNAMNQPIPNIKAQDKLLADTGTEAHRIYMDADLLDQLRRMCGYVENGSDTTVKIGQDDATRDWFLTVGYNASNRRIYSSTSFHQVIREAAKAEIEDETCKFCGFDVEFPCEAPPADICSAAISAANRAERLKPRITVKADASKMEAGFAAASAGLKQGARDLMNKTLLELATTYSNRTAKRIIMDVGGAYKMKDIPDDKVQAVTIAARDRIALENRLEELRAGGDTAGVESLLRGTQGKVAGSPETAARQVEIQDKLHRVVAVTREEYGMQTDPLLDQMRATATMQIPTIGGANRIYDQLRNAGVQADPPAEEAGPSEKDKQWVRDNVQGQGGEFDGGGASGDWKE